MHYISVIGDAAATHTILFDVIRHRMRYHVQGQKSGAVVNDTLSYQEVTFYSDLNHLLHNIYDISAWTHNS